MLVYYVTAYRQPEALGDEFGDPAWSESLVAADAQAALYAACARKGERIVDTAVVATATALGISTESGMKVFASVMPEPGISYLPGPGVGPRLIPASGR